MSLYDSERRYRRRIWGGMARLLVLLGAVSVTAMVAYGVGTEELTNLQRQHQEQLLEIEQARSAVEQEAANLLVAVEKARVDLAEWERRYAAEVPTGDRDRLLALVDERLQAGIDPGRLGFLIAVAEARRECEPVETRRFLVKTPLYDGANTAVSFAGGAVTVSAFGESALTDSGLLQAWFDPVRPVILTFMRIDGAAVEIAGRLPLQRSVIQGGFEHHFLVRAGARGFAEVSAERCAYP